ncbi:MAG: hypothetical protein LH650_10460, partial [Chloroflexi bacterium]|nr:hypothetical protein [Chloroflexota bacterium]
MARQRIALREGSASATLEPDLLDRSADMFVREAARTPGQLMSGLLRADPSTRTRAVQRLQAGLGNAALIGILSGRPARTTVQREEKIDGTDDGPQPLDTGT